MCIYLSHAKVQIWSQLMLMLIWLLSSSLCSWFVTIGAAGIQTCLAAFLYELCTGCWCVCAREVATGGPGVIVYILLSRYVYTNGRDDNVFFSIIFLNPILLNNWFLGCWFPQGIGRSGPELSVRCWQWSSTVAGGGWTGCTGCRLVWWRRGCILYYSLWWP